MVGDHDFHAARGYACRQAGGAARRREFHRVVDQIGDGLLDQCRIAERGQLVRQVGGQRHAALLRDRFVQFGHPRQRWNQVDPGKGRAAGACLDLGDAQQGLEHRDDAIQIGGGPLDRRPQFGGGFGVQRCVFQAGAGAGDRGAQVVRDGVGHLAHALHQAADAVQHVVDDLRQLVELVAAPGQADPLREVAAGDGRGGGRNVGQGAAEQSADHECPGGGHPTDDQQRP